MKSSTSSAHAHVVILGGGNGTSRLLSALVPMVRDGEIDSLYGLVHMADDGGSTGRLREQYDVGAMGDLTKCLMALSSLRGDIRGEKFLAALEYRFANGDFVGHTLRNVLLTALELTSDLDAAIATMARVLQVPKFTGVIPTTLVPLTQQVAVKTDATWEVIGEGEHFIAHNVDVQSDGKKPEDVQVTFKEDAITLNPRALQALLKATHIIVAPGHTYGTILPTLASLKVSGQITELPGKVIVVMTLLTTPKQTTGWSGEDFVRVYESYLGKKASVVIANNTPAPIELVPGQDWVTFTDKQHEYRLISKELVSKEIQAKQTGDVVPRAIAVHDQEKLRNVFRSILVS